MADRSTAKPLSDARQPILKIRRFRLFASTKALLGQNSFQLDIPDQSPVVVLGQNGTGKSLVTAVLHVAFGPVDSGDGLVSGLREAGLERIDLGLDLSGLAGNLQWSLLSGERQVTWDRRDEAGNGHLGQDYSALRHEADQWAATLGAGIDARRLSEIHFVHSGDVQLSFDDELLRALREEAVLPTRREIAAWVVRLHELGGEDGKGGRLGQARGELRDVEERIRYVDDVQQKLETARHLQSELIARLELLTSQRSMVKAELEEWMKLAALGERARRINSWLDEIRREFTEVAWLREQHSTCQERVDRLENLYRGAPDNLDEIYRLYQSARQEESLLLSKLDGARRQSTQLDDAIAAVRAELSANVRPTFETSRAGQEQSRTELGRIENELTELLRERIELIRRRDGLQLQIQRDFPMFNDLPPSARDKLDEYFDWEEKSEERTLALKLAESDARRQNEETLKAHRSRLSESFHGFESLPNHATDLLRELFDRRRLAVTLRADQEELERKRVLLSSQQQGKMRHWWTLGAGVMAALLGVLVGGWDIALFFGLSASGIVMLVMKLLYGDHERQLEKTLQAGNLTASRLLETTETIERLQASLSPLGKDMSLEEGLERLNDYRQLCREIERLESSEPGELNLSSNANTSLKDQFALQLPDRLLSLPPAFAKLQYAAFREIEGSIEQLDSELRAFEGGGSKAIAVRTHETRIAQLKESIELSEHDLESQLQAYESRRRELNEQITILESRRALSQSADQVEIELTVLRQRIAGLVVDSGGFLERTEDTKLLDDIRSLQELRGEMRRIRDSLSMHQSLEELRARETLLAEELEEAKSHLSELDPLYLLDGTVADYAAKYGRQLEAAGESLALTESALDKVRQEIEAVEVDHWSNVLAGCESLDELRERAAAAQERVTSAEHDALTARETVSHLQDDCDGQFREHHGELLMSIHETIRRLSDNKCRALMYADGRISIELSDGSTRSLMTLSTGMRDLVWCGVRLALLEHRRELPRMPVIWDEPWSRLDDDLLRRVGQAVRALAEHRQVIILTRDQRLAEWGATIFLTEAGAARERLSAADVGQPLVPPVNEGMI